MRSQSSSAGRARSTACEALGSLASCGFPIGGAAIAAAFGLAGSGPVTAAGAAAAAGAVTTAGERAAVDAGGAAGAEPDSRVAAGEASSLATDSGAESQGLCQQAAASGNTAVAANRSPSLAANAR